MTSTTAQATEAVKPDLWKQALATLSTEDQKQCEGCSSSMLDVLKQVCRCAIFPSGKVSIDT